MLASIYVKLAAVAVLLFALAGFGLWCHHKGATSVQAQWDAAKAVQTAAADRQALASTTQTLRWTQQFAQTATHYEALNHETTPAVADAVTTAVAAGTVRLRDEAPTVACPGTVSVAASRSRAADAAATQALADRLTNSIAAVRAGDIADARERQLGQQIIALQALLAIERQQSPAQ